MTEEDQDKEGKYASVRKLDNTAGLRTNRKSDNFHMLIQNEKSPLK